jgi:hypothetical protein
MNVKFIKDWEGNRGKIHPAGSYHKIGTAAARQLIKQGYCVEMPEHLGLLQLYRNPELIPDEYKTHEAIEVEKPKEAVIEEIDNDDLGLNGFFNKFKNK